MLIALRAALPAGDTPPDRLLIANWGENRNHKGLSVRVDEVVAARLAANQLAEGFDTVALDFEHNTVRGTPAYKDSKEPRPVAAHGKPVVVQGEGIYLTDLKWTPDGIQAYSARYYPDLSPAVKTDSDGRIELVHSAGLCRQGSVYGLHAFSADPFSDTMDHKTLLLTLLGLAATATDADIETAAKAFASKIDAANQTAAQATTAAQAAKSSAEGAATEVKAMSARSDAIERDLITLNAVVSGKIVPTTAATLPIDQFRKLVSELPAGQVPLDRRTPEGVQTFSASLNSDSKLTGRARVAAAIDSGRR